MRIVEAAISVPADLASFILGKVKAMIAAAGTMWTPPTSPSLRRLVFAGGGAGNIGVTRDEADALFDINDACKAGSNDETWPDFFAKAVADSLTAVSPFKVESREDTAKDDAWLSERESTGGFLAKMAHVPDVRGAMHDIFHPFDEQADEWKQAVAEMDVAESDAGDDHRRGSQVAARPVRRQRPRRAGAASDRPAEDDLAAVAGSAVRGDESRGLESGVARPALALADHRREPSAAL